MCEFCGERGAGPISLGMCGMLMMVSHRDTQNWGCPNSFPHTFSHPLILRRFKKMQWFSLSLDLWGFVFKSNDVSSAFMTIFDHAYHPSPHPPIHPASLPLPDINWWHLVPSSASRLSCPTPTHAGGSKYIFADVETLGIMEGLWLGNEVSCFTISS